MIYIYNCSSHIIANLVKIHHIYLILHSKFTNYYIGFESISEMAEGSHPHTQINNR